MRTFNDLAEDLEEHDGVRCYTMETLAKIYGITNLDLPALQDIAESLDRRDIGYSELSTVSKGLVRLHLKDSAAALMINACNTIDHASVDLLKNFVDKRVQFRKIAELKRLVEKL